MKQNDIKNQPYTLYDVFGIRHFSKPVFLTINYEYMDETGKKSWMLIKNLSLAKALVKYGTWEYKSGTLKTINSTPDAEYMSIELIEPRILEKEKTPMKFDDRRPFGKDPLVLSERIPIQTEIEENYDYIM